MSRYIPRFRTWCSGHRISRESSRDIAGVPSQSSIEACLSITSQIDSMRQKIRRLSFCEPPDTRHFIAPAGEAILQVGNLRPVQDSRLDP